MKKSLPFFILVCFSSVLFAGLAQAQKHSALALPDLDETHAAEAAAWLSHFINPTNEANYDSLKLIGFAQLQAINNSAAMKVTSSAAWEEVSKSQGGDVSGRPSGIAFASDGTLYLATTNGGLWKSTDNGQHWVSLSDTWKELPTGGVAVNPQNPNTVYAGTGIYLSGIGGGGNIDGIGVYKSYDGGLNWVLLDSTSSLVTTQMEVNPADTNIIYRATTSGVRVSTDAGLTWKNTSSIGGATSLVIDPLDPAVLYAGGNRQIQKSTDSGLSWSALSGYPTGDIMTLAMSQSSSDTIYLSTGLGYYGSIANSQSILALSTDAGASWTTVSSGVKYTGTQSYYDNAVAVNPQNPAMVVVGGLDIYRSTHGGGALGRLTDWTTDPAAQNYTHADIHILKYNPYTKVLFALSDGGVFYSLNNGSTWKQDMNADLGTLLFIGGDMAVDPNTNKPLYFAAGAQDNGLNRFVPGHSYYDPVVKGDGGTAFISPSDNITVYGTYVNADLYKSQDGGTNWGNGANLLEGTPILTNGEDAPFYMEYDVAEQDPNIVAVCGNKNLFLSTDGGAVYGADFPQVTNVPGNLTATRISGTVTTVHIAKADDSYIYLGTASSRFYYSTDQGSTWTSSTTPLTFSGPPSSITTDPNDPAHVFMTVSGPNSKHFWVSTDNGVTWTAPATNLPNLNYRRVAADPNGVVYVGNDYTVLRSGDGGVTWYPVADGLPLAMVTSLRVRGNYLCATTYGRGMYYVNLTQLPPLPSASVAQNSKPVNSSIAISAVYPSIVSSSAPQTTVNYSLDAGSEMTLAVYDVLGRQERMLVNQYAAQGSHEIRADLSGLTPGEHYLVLTSSGVSVTKPITVQ